MRVAIVGQGYVGLPLAMAAVSGGHEVVGIDSDAARVALLSSGESPVEDISSRELANASAYGKYSVSSDYSAVSNCSVVCICVPTPLDESGAPDVSALKSALSGVAPHLASDSLVIVESTIATGSIRGFISELLSSLCSVPFELVYSPERVDPGNPNWKIANTPKMLAGLTDEGAERARAFYSTFIEKVVVVSSVEVAETAKLLENSFRLVNISFINEISVFCSKIGIDVREVVDAAASKPYGFMPFYPSAGVGGHCIPVDPSYLLASAKEVGVPLRFVELANEVNNEMPYFFAGKAAGMLNGVKGKKIIVIGVGYKAGTSDVRESPAGPLIRILRDEGAFVSWHDPLVDTWHGEKSVPLVSGMDLAILVNPSGSIDFSPLGNTPILDTRGGMR